MQPFARLDAVLLPIVLPAGAVPALIEAARAAPGARVGIDLEAQTVTVPNGTVHRFDIDPRSKHCLLRGIDEIDFTLTQLDMIAAFERRQGSQLIT